MPGDAPGDWSLLAGVARPLDPWALAAAADKLPAGSYRLAEAPGPALHGWLLAQHRFDRYRADPEPRGPRVLLVPRRPISPGRWRWPRRRRWSATSSTRRRATSIPPRWPTAIVAEGARFGAAVTVIDGDALATGFPAVHAVGRAASVAPRLIDLTLGRPARTRR